MAWYEDLTPCDYFGPELAPSLRAIGWLECGKPFPTGAVDRRVYETLTAFRAAPWSPPMVTAGVHICDLCLYEGEAGSQNLFIPGDGFLYVSPELITHYMNVHGYQPPAPFCQAVLACPPMRSIGYLRAVLANGGRPFARGSGGSRSSRPPRPA